MISSSASVLCHLNPTGRGSQLKPESDCLSSTLGLQGLSSHSEGKPRFFPYPIEISFLLPHPCSLWSPVVTTSFPPHLTPCSSLPVELHAQSGPTSLEWKPFLGKGKVQTGIKRSHVWESRNLEDSRGSFPGDSLWEGDWSVELQRFPGPRSCLHSVQRARCGCSHEPSPVLGCTP